jgi:hypothetical protein
MINVSISSPNIAEVQQRVQKLGERLLMFDMAMESIGDEVVSYLAGQGFASQGGVFGQPWEPLTDKYALYKATGHTIVDRNRWRKNVIAERYPGAGPEIRTGAMQSGYYFNSNSTSVTISNEKAEGDDPYFIFQQEGTDRGLPARTLIAVNDDIRAIITDIIAQDIKDKINSVGL